MKNLIIAVFLSIIANLSFGQDIITEKNGDQLKVKIIKMSEQTVSFYYYDDPEKIEVTMNRSLIRNIKFEYGRTEEEKAPELNENYFVDDKRNNVMINLTSIPGQSTTLSYERAINPLSSFGGAIKLHGVGTESGEYDNKSGFGIEANYKVKSGAVFKKNDYRPKHMLRGFYLRPDVGYTRAKLEDDYDNDNDPEYKEKYSYIYGGTDIGYEWIFANRLSLDIYSGVNFYGGSYKVYEDVGNGYYNESNSDPYITDGNMTGYNNTAVRYGVQIGFLF